MTGTRELTVPEIDMPSDEAVLFDLCNRVP